VPRKAFDRLFRPRNLAAMFFLTLWIGIGFFQRGPAAAIPALAFVALVVLLMLRAVEHLAYVSCKKDAADISAGKCSRCGYSLSRLPTPKCPECGLDTAEHVTGCEAAIQCYRDRWL
jgi:hypothetical protein